MKCGKCVRSCPSGCIALEKANLTALVQWLDEDASPRIVIAQDG